jgi:hypothetical protein
MARIPDFPARPKPDKEPEPKSEETAGEQPLSDAFVADVRLGKREVELTMQLEQAREEEAAFEERYGMAFEEFQASFDPGADARLSEDYLAWSRAAERVRMLRYELARLAERPARRTRQSSKGGSEEPAEGAARSRREVADEIEQVLRGGRRSARPAVPDPKRGEKPEKRGRPS